MTTSTAGLTGFSFTACLHGLSYFRTTSKQFVHVIGLGSLLKNYDVLKLHPSNVVANLETLVHSWEKISITR